MKIKKLVALALAGTMVFSMAACEGKKDDKKGSTNSKTKNTVEVQQIMHQKWKLMVSQ